MTILRIISSRRNEAKLTEMIDDFDITKSNIQLDRIMSGNIVELKTFLLKQNKKKNRNKN